jgi:hypothetical protein
MNYHLFKADLKDSKIYIAAYDPALHNGIPRSGLVYVEQVETYIKKLLINKLQLLTLDNDPSGSFSHQDIWRVTDSCRGPINI